jgi:thiol-disulfide isomerase/thioredoxin
MRRVEVSGRCNDPPDGWVDVATRHFVAARRRTAGCASAALAILAVAAGATAETPHELPPFTHGAASEWINSAPLDSTGLRGHPVLVEIWTFECSNCLATLPWLRRIASVYQRRGLVVVGVHTPELPEEHDRDRVAAAVRRLDIRYPVMLDTDSSYWRSLGNRYWPAFYLYDEAGRLLATRVGELHTGESTADTFERLVASRLPAAGDEHR